MKGHYDLFVVKHVAFMDAGKQYDKLEMSVPFFATMLHRGKDNGAVMKYLNDNPSVGRKLVEETGLNIQGCRPVSALA